MAIDKYYSAKRIIADFWRDFRPTNTSWAIDAIEWIAQGLDSIGGGFNVEKAKFKTYAENHRVLLPCSSKGIIEVIHNDVVLPMRKVLNITDYDVTVDPFWSHHNDAYIYTSFEEGELEIWYYTTVTEFDEQTGLKYPLIPDDGENWIRLFLQEFLLMKWLLRGNTHPVRNFNEVREGIYTRYGNGGGLLHRAKSAASFPSINDVEMAARSNLGLHKDWNKKVLNWFNANGKNVLVNGEARTYTNEYIEIQYPTPE